MAGLDNIEVGLTDSMPNEGVPVDSDSYMRCGTHRGAVRLGDKITVNCMQIPQRYRFVIVVTSDSVAERLCLAEVGVFAGTRSPSHYCHHVSWQKKDNH